MYGQKLFFKGFALYLYIRTKCQDQDNFVGGVGGGGGVVWISVLFEVKEVWYPRAHTLCII